MDFAEIIYDKKDRVATVTMNRPAKLNAWTPKMGAEMRTAMLDAERDPAVGAIIVTGAGRAYCAGADMGALSEVAVGTASARGAVVQDEWLSAQRADYRTSYSWPLALNTSGDLARSTARAWAWASPPVSTRTSGSRRTMRGWD